MTRMKAIKTRFGIRFPRHSQFSYLCYECQEWTPTVYTWSTCPEGGAAGRCHGERMDGYASPCPLFVPGEKADMPEIGEFGEVVG